MFLQTFGGLRLLDAAGHECKFPRKGLLLGAYLAVGPSAAGLAIECGAEIAYGYRELGKTDECLEALRLEEPLTNVPGWLAAASQLRSSGGVVIKDIDFVVAVSSATAVSVGLFDT